MSEKPDTVDFKLRDYLMPGGCYPYESLAPKMEQARNAGFTVYLWSVPGFLMVAGHPGNEKRPWSVETMGTWRYYSTAAKAIRG
jgi:hypothetical protein